MLSAGSFAAAGHFNFIKANTHVRHAHCTLYTSRAQLHLLFIQKQQMQSILFHSLNSQRDILIVCVCHTLIRLVACYSHTNRQRIIFAATIFPKKNIFILFHSV